MILPIHKHNGGWKTINHLEQDTLCKEHMMKPHIYRQNGKWKAVYRFNRILTRKEVFSVMQKYFENDKFQQEARLFVERLNNGT